MKGRDNVNRIKRCFICVWELLYIAPLSTMPHHLGDLFVEDAAKQSPQQPLLGCYYTQEGCRKFTWHQSDS